MKQIIQFYGKECPYCKALEPAVEKLEKDDDVRVTKLEVWYDEDNKKKMEGLQPLFDESCGGSLVTPSFYDEEGGRVLCNPETYENLKKWVFA